MAFLADSKLQKLLDSHYQQKNTFDEISPAKPDPLLVARAYKDNALIDEIALICALFSYGNAGMIVKFLQTLDFSLLEQNHSVLGKSFRPYRFQSSKDVAFICEIIRLCVQEGGIKKHFIKAYKAAPKAQSWRFSQHIYHCKILQGIYACIDFLREIAFSLLPKNTALSQGMEFYLGKSYCVESLPANAAPLKRWNMYLRWLVRKDDIDLGLWGEVDKAHLILPLDTHSFRICQKLGLISLKSPNLRAALEASDNLSAFCPSDPVKYDFALYRIGQYKELESKI